MRLITSNKLIMMNLTIIKLNLTLKVEAPAKPTAKSSKNEKMFDDHGESYGGLYLCKHSQD